MRRIIIAIACIAIVMGMQAKDKTTDRVVAKTEQMADTTAKREPQPVNYLYPTKEGQLLQVYRGGKGGLFVERVSKKSGKQYRQYISTDKQKAKLIPTK